MAALLPGFEYDIFISYRQKDNKGDHWVTEFVNALKAELEATFKEDVSIYFDENPHDGLHEHHDVDDSLREKLKSLIFIPILSRTYCDEKSFAFEHEFKPFVEQTSKDFFGLKVKLGGGNVASRVLPVKIHELDRDDVLQFETVTGGALRSIDFIYKETGVNRPLKASDSKGENQTRADYRNQVNKVANATREIITCLKNPIQALPSNDSAFQSVVEPNLKSDFTSLEPQKDEAHNGTLQVTQSRSASISWRWVSIVLVFLLIFLIARTLMNWGRVGEDQAEYIPIDFSNPYRGRSPWVVTAKVSPDGGKIVYYTTRGEHYAWDFGTGKSRLISSELPPVLSFCFSPHGDSMIFRSVAWMGQLFTVSMATGQTRMIADSVLGYDPAWSDNGWIYHINLAASLCRVRVTGNRSELLIPKRKLGESHILGSLHALPGGRGVLFALMNENSSDLSEAEIHVLDLHSKEIRLVTKGIEAMYTNSGLLLVGQADGSIIAGRFDLQALKAEGEFLKVLEGVETGVLRSHVAASFSLSEGGDLLYIAQSGMEPDEVLWIDRYGNILDKRATLGGWVNSIDLSSDGRHLVGSVHMATRDAPSLWIKEVGGELFKRLTSSRVLDYSPQFIESDTHVAYISPKNWENWDLYTIPVDGSGDPERILNRPGDIQTPDFSADGQWVAFTERNAVGQLDLKAHRFGKDSLTLIVAATPSDESAARISPDGRWIAYVSKESGIEEVYVQPFPYAKGGRWQISTKGGTSPAWSHSGGELFYRSSGSEFIAVPISRGEKFSYGSPKVLFQLGDLLWSRVITADDKSFLMIRRNLRAPGQVILVKNWIREVERRLNQVE